MNNARLVVKSETTRIVSCRPRDRIVDIYSEEGPSEFICCCRPGEIVTSVDKHPSATEGSMEFSVGNRYYNLRYSQLNTDLHNLVQPAQGNWGFILSGFALVVYGGPL
jgi:hypothetical protein